MKTNTEIDDLSHLTELLLLDQLKLNQQKKEIFYFLGLIWDQYLPLFPRIGPLDTCSHRKMKISILVGSILVDLAREPLLTLLDAGFSRVL